MGFQFGKHELGQVTSLHVIELLDVYRSYIQFACNIHDLLVGGGKGI